MAESKQTIQYQARTAAQNRKIWALKNELYLSEENLRDVVEQVTCQRSISALSMQQAGRLIDRLEDYKRRQKQNIKTARAKAGNVIAMITPKQQAMINVLAEKVRWKHADGFHRFLKSRLNIETIKTNSDVTKVKKALEILICYQRLNKEAQYDE